MRSMEVDVESLNAAWRYHLVNVCDGQVSILQAWTIVLHGYRQTLADEYPANGPLRSKHLVAPLGF